MYRSCTLSPLMLALGVLIAGCTPKEPPTPEETVKQFLSLAQQGKWEEASKLLVLDAKAAEMFGDLYTNGEAGEKQRTQEILTQRLKGSLEKEQESLAREPPVFGTLPMGDTKERVQVSVTYGEIMFLYTLQLYPDWNQQGPAWIIHDRTHEKKGVRASTKPGVKAILRQIEQKLGHPPTLKELNDVLPEAMGSIRVRGFRVGSPGSSGSPSASPPAVKGEPVTPAANDGAAQSPANPN